MLRDTYLLLGRHMRRSLRQPVWLFISLFQPVMYLLLFMPLLRGLAGGPGFTGANVEQIFVPGLLVMVSIFSSGFAGFGVIDDKRRGIIERLLVTPASRWAILLSMIARDLIILLIQLLLLTGLSLLLGLQLSLAGFLVGLVLMICVGLLMTSFSYALAFVVNDEGGLASTTNLVFMPVLLLSGIMLPLSLAPQWLQATAKVNPFSYVVSAQRLLFGGTFEGAVIWQAFAFVAGLALLTLWWAIRSLRRMSA